ncbi:MAG TPA: YdeI/OmpD-associated family protein [Gemmatimonadales bacterium]|nr:YdeI/OmpD-associated family protein [Gemmatimonadales bacterium]
MSTPQRFTVVLEQADHGEATGITIPFDVPAVFGTRARVPVRGTLNGFPFRSSIMPMGGRFMMAVNRAMREGARAKAGDRVEVVMERDDAPRTVEPPADLAAAIAAWPGAAEAWEKLSYTHKKEWARHVEGAKKAETRERRIRQAVEEMAAGIKPRY